MKVAVLTRNNYRSPRFLANSLHNMLNRIGVEHTIFYHGIEDLKTSAVKNAGFKLDLQAKIAKQKIKSWESYDLFIVCDNLDSLSPAVPIESLRLLGKPVLFHEVFYPGGSQYWMNQLSNDSLSRFDGYLTVSSLHDDPIVENKNVYSIGLDLSSCEILSKPDLPFTALLDFERKGYEKEREVQLNVLKHLNINTITLNKEYTFSEIEAIYNKANIYFVASPEAYGVPIAQLQFYGSAIASPYTAWVKRHAIRPDNSTCDNLSTGEFSDNFIFYSSESELTKKLMNLKNNYNAAKVKERFFQSQPEFCFGKPLDLWTAVSEYAI
ncbi:MAG: hypothetical protein RQ733_13590 [Methyloprofundus sp.]|nr:hypothetical protein [Methyloprofundus sp.]